jgi:hypothetical protein
MNYLCAALYLALVYGACCQLATLLWYPDQAGPDFSPPSTRAYYIGVLPVMLLGMGMQWVSCFVPGVLRLRYRVNRLLMERLAFFVRCVPLIDPIKPIS